MKVDDNYNKMIDEFANRTDFQINFYNSLFIYFTIFSRKQ